eukprot:363759-Chlamydomonas_euryale.AAC.26
MHKRGDGSGYKQAVHHGRLAIASHLGVMLPMSMCAHPIAGPSRLHLILPGVSGPVLSVRLDVQYLAVLVGRRSSCKACEALVSGGNVRCRAAACAQPHPPAVQRCPCKPRQGG